MLKMKKMVLLVLLMVGVIGCTSTSDVTYVEGKSPKVNLKGYKTYAPLLKAGILLDSRGIWIPRDMDMNSEIQFLTKKELDKLGKQQVQTNPDFYVSYIVGVDMDKIKEKVSRRDQLTISNVPSNSLAIIFIDAVTNQIIWISTAEGQLKQDLSNEKIKKRMKKVIHKMFSSL